MYDTETYSDALYSDQLDLDGLYSDYAKLCYIIPMKLRMKHTNLKPRIQHSKNQEYNIYYRDTLPYNSARSKKSVDKSEKDLMTRYKSPHRSSKHRYDDFVYFDTYHSKSYKSKSEKNVYEVKKPKLNYEFVDIYPQKEKSHKKNYTHEYLSLLNNDHYYPLVQHKIKNKSQYTQTIYDIPDKKKEKVRKRSRHMQTDLDAKYEAMKKAYGIYLDIQKKKFESKYTQTDTPTKVEIERNFEIKTFVDTDNDMFITENKKIFVENENGKVISIIRWFRRVFGLFVYIVYGTQYSEKQILQGIYTCKNALANQQFFKQALSRTNGINRV